MAQLIARNADLDNLPTPCDHLPGTTRICLGDLHGNALKLIYCLIQEGFLSLEQEADYLALKKIYNTPCQQLTQQHIACFNQLIDAAKINKNLALTLIGDEFADRGNNDYFTLKVIRKLHQEHVNLEIMLSNHAMEFLFEYASGHFSGKQPFAYNQGQSMPSMKKLFDLSLVNEAEIRTWISQDYLPLLKAVGYQVELSQNRITLFTHAPVGLEVVAALAQELGVAYDESSIPRLTASIDKINDNLLSHIEQFHQDIYQIYPAIYDLTWNRGGWDAALLTNPHELAKHRQHYVFVKNTHDLESQFYYVLSSSNLLPIPLNAKALSLLSSKLLTTRTFLPESVLSSIIPDDLYTITLADRGVRIMPPMRNYQVYFVHGHNGLGNMFGSHFHNLDNYFGKGTDCNKTDPQQSIIHLVRES